MFASWNIDGAYHHLNKNWWGINGPVSWTLRTQKISKNQNLYPLQSRNISSTLLKVRYSRKNIGIISIAQKMCCVLILSFVFWIFPPLDTAVQLESADSKQNAISKSLFHDSFRHIFWAMRKMHHTFWKSFL